MSSFSVWHHLVLFQDALLWFSNVCNGSIPAGQDGPVRWSHPMQMAGQVECKQVVKWDANAWSSQVQRPKFSTVSEYIPPIRSK